MSEGVFFRLLACGIVWAPAAFLPGCSGDEDSTIPADSTGDSDSETAIDGGVAEVVYAMHVVDVGNGVAVFVEGPDFSLVYDAGSDDADVTGDNNRFIAYLKKMRPDLQHIDHVILSHPHNDHMSMLPDVLETYSIGEVWDAGAMSDRCSYHAFLAAIAEHSITYHSPVNDEGVRDIALLEPCDGYPDEVTLTHGERITAGLTVGLGDDAEMTFLFANATPVEDPNDNSMVVRLDVGDKRFLLMGDAGGGETSDISLPPEEGSIEAFLLDGGADVDADVLLVGFHGYGSASRIPFLDAVTPAVSIITPYPRAAPPDDDVVAALEARGEVYRTDFEDDDCVDAADKLGPDDDGQIGGCSNVRVTVDDTGQLRAEYLYLTD